MENVIIFSGLIQFSGNSYIIGCYKAMHSKNSQEGKKIHLRIIDSSFKKVSDVMSAKEMFPQTKKSVAGSNGKVQWRVGHCQSHFKEAQLNSEVIFNLRVIT